MTALQRFAAERLRARCERAGVPYEDAVRLLGFIHSHYPPDRQSPIKVDGTDLDLVSYARHVARNAQPYHAGMEDLIWGFLTD